VAQARAFSHVGITVPDLDRAVDFYTKVFGWYLIMKPTKVVEDDSAIGIMCKDVFGNGFGTFRIAHMSTSDKIGVELFEWAGHGKAEEQPRVPQERHFPFLRAGPGNRGDGEVK
jgi:catechol 2,3-dioxygenase-like lactoylglutathione lyase family enzyme